MITKHVRRLNLVFIMGGLLSLASCGDDATVDPDAGAGDNHRGDGDDSKDDGSKGDGDDTKDDGDGDAKGDGDGDTRGDGDGDTEGDGDGDGDGDSETMTPADPETGRLTGITKAHNDARARVTTMPALQPLTWDSEIAEVAQAYAEKLAKSCSTMLVHSGNKKYGENLAWFQAYPTGSPSSGSAAMTVMAWEGEKVCYTLGVIGDAKTCSSACMKSSCGHYTQVAWRTTERVGCGVADCSSGEGRGSYWVCNYDPPGNYIGEKPY